MSVSLVLAVRIRRYTPNFSSLFLVLPNICFSNSDTSFLLAGQTDTHIPQALQSSDSMGLPAMKFRHLEGQTATQNAQPMHLSGRTFFWSVSLKLCLMIDIASLDNQLFFLSLTFIYIFLLHLFWIFHEFSK